MCYTDWDNEPQKEEVNVLPETPPARRQLSTRLGQLGDLLGESVGRRSAVWSDSDFGICG